MGGKKLKKRRSIVIASSLIGITISYLIYYFISDEKHSFQSITLTLISTISSIIGMTIYIYSTQKDIKNINE
jgi:FtsH-binding integral membrane protein